MQQDITTKIQAICLEHGISPPNEVIIDGMLHRFDDEKRKPNSYYKVYPDGVPAGFVGNWRLGLLVNFSLKGDYKLTAKDKREIEIAKQQRANEKLVLQNKAAAKAFKVMAKSVPAIDHPYLIKKRVRPHNALVCRDAWLIPTKLKTDNALIIPIYNNGEFVTVQFISPTGDKRYVYGSRLSASYSCIGEYQAGQPILICEGWATGATLYEATGYLTYMALMASNLEAVARYVRNQYQTAQILICGDNDESGTGQREATKAAEAIGGKALISPENGCDFNDLAINTTEQEPVIVTVYTPCGKPLQVTARDAKHAAWLVEVNRNQKELV